jgi:hypothetical protein
MSEIVISCPKCQRGLKLRDRSKLGKKARCPKCQTVFFLTAPPEDDEVELQLASPATSQPAVGVGGHWVPDDVGASPAAPASQPAAQPAAAMFVDAAAQRGGLDVAPEDKGGAAHLKAIRKKNARRRNIAIVAGVFTACAVGGVLYAARDFVNKEKKEQAEKAAPQRDDETVAEKDELEKTTAIANAASPTSGEKLKLNGLPLGARILISLRPSELWAEGSRGEEVRYSLGPIGEWAELAIKEFTQREPAEIEQIIFAVIPGIVGEPAQTAAVFRFVEKQSKAKLILEYGGDANEEFGYKIYVGDTKAFALIDLQTMAVCPKELASEMAQSIQYASPQDDGIDALIHETDTDRHLSIIFDPRSIARHRDTMFPGVVWPTVDQFTQFFNDEEVETVLWSFHLGDRKFFSEILMRNRTIIKEHLLQREMRKKLKQAPYDIWHMVEKMDPKKIGPRKIIGRFPAMTQLFAKATIGGMGSRYAQLVTSLDERAAPNLALGALLTWDESTRTDFTIDAPIRQQGTGTKLPDLIADRLKMKIEVEFNLTPLQEAFAYIAEECKTGVDIDGDALKDKGYTKNMSQTFKMENTGLAAIKDILDRYETMCLVIQEDKKQFLITTETFAEKNGQKVYEFK